MKPNNGKILAELVCNSKAILRYDWWNIYPHYNHSGSHTHYYNRGVKLYKNVMFWSDSIWSCLPYIRVWITLNPHFVARVDYANEINIYLIDYTALTCRMQRSYHRTSHLPLYCLSHKPFFSIRPSIAIIHRTVHICCIVRGVARRGCEGMIRRSSPSRILCISLFIFIFIRVSSQSTRYYSY